MWRGISWLLRVMSVYLSVKSETDPEVGRSPMGLMKIAGQRRSQGREMGHHEYG